jgi:mannose-6-phosphate isomerase-like protein (cupin superfamily)
LAPRQGWRLERHSGTRSARQSETKHFHNASRQFFFVLDGEATIDVGTEVIRLGKHEGMEIPPGLTHQFRNETTSDVVFLVVSTPPSQGDRVEM